MNFSCLEGDFVASLSRKGVVEVESSAFHFDVDAGAEAEGIVE